MDVAAVVDVAARLRQPADVAAAHVAVPLLRQAHSVALQVPLPRRPRLLLSLPFLHPRLIRPMPTPELLRQQADVAAADAAAVALVAAQLQPQPVHRLPVDVALQHRPAPR